MRTFSYTIADPQGIHARPAGMLARAAKRFGDTAITIGKDGRNVRASQLIMLMGLGVKAGDRITVTAQGTQEEAAIAEMERICREHL